MRTPARLRTGKNKTVNTSSRNLSRYIALDRIVSNQFNGEYTVPQNQSTIRYNVRKIDTYCRESGTKPENLTKEELKNFILS